MSATDARPRTASVARPGWALFGFAAFVAVARLVVDLLVGSSWTLLPVWLLPLDYLASPATVLVGAMLLRRMSADVRVGRLLVAAGTIVAVAAALFTAAHLGLGLMASANPETRSAASAAATLSNGLFPFTYTWPALLALLYPQGRFGSRPAVRVFALLIGSDLVVAGSYVLSAVVAPPPYDSIPNPLLVPATVSPVGSAIFAVGLLGMLIGEMV